jgi:hypothetical protein
MAGRRVNAQKEWSSVYVNTTESKTLNKSAEAVVFVSMAGRRVDGSAGSGEYVSMAGRKRINARSAAGICEHDKGRVNAQGNAGDSDEDICEDLHGRQKALCKNAGEHSSII